MSGLKSVFKELTGLDYESLKEDRKSYSWDTKLYHIVVHRASDIEGVYIVTEIKDNGRLTRSLTILITADLDKNLILNLARAYPAYHTLRNVSPPYFRENIPSRI